MSVQGCVERSDLGWGPGAGGSPLPGRGVTGSRTGAVGVSGRQTWNDPGEGVLVGGGWRGPSRQGGVIRRSGSRGVTGAPTRTPPPSDSLGEAEDG